MKTGNNGKVIPFKDDLLFHFFNKKTQISDTYLLDPISQLKLYPKQSNCVKSDALSTGFSLPNSEVDLIGKVEVLLHHKLADVENLGFIWASQNSSGPDYATTGLYLATGKAAYYSYFKGSTSGACAINTSALEDDNFYIFTTDFNTANVTMKANKVTIANNALVIGSDINGTTTAKGTGNLTADIGVLSGRNNSAYVYSSKHKIIWIKFYDKQGALMHEFNFSEGYGEQAFDVVTGDAYQISNINPDLFWNYKQDFHHYNFRYGFTLYQKSGSPDIRIPNKKDGTEITPASIPSGYTRIANYKECRTAFNQCESKFKLDNVTNTDEFFTVAGGNPVYNVNGDYYYVGDFSGKGYYDDPVTAARLYYDGVKWCCYNGGVNQYVAAPGDEATPDLATWDTITVTKTEAQNSDLYDADVDRVLFDVDGVAKEIDVGALDVDTGYNRGYMYINPNVSEKDFMLYGTDKTLTDDLKIIKYIGLGDEVLTDESGEVIYDENDHVILE